MKTPYQTRQLERIIASALARRFAHQVSEEQSDKMLEAQAKMNEAARDYRMMVEQTVDDILHSTKR